MSETVSNSERETELAGERFGQRVPDGAVVAMYGELGSGKTAFVRGMARGMGIDCRVSSPTFTIVNEYRAGNGRAVYHFDFYRIERLQEVLDIGYEEYVDSDGLCLMEWPEKIEPILPEDTLRVHIAEQPDGSRSVTF